MGTRHVVKVIEGDEEKIRMYGQWDGYLGTVVPHLKGAIARIGVEKLRDILNNVRVNRSDEADEFHIDECFFGYKHEYSAIEDMVDAFRRGTDDWDYSYIKSIPFIAQFFNKEAVAEYFMKTRDTGYKVLDVLYELSLIGAEIPSYFSESEPGRVYTVDFDSKTLIVDYFGTELSWKFGDIPSDEEIERIEEMIDNCEYPPKAAV